MNFLEAHAHTEAQYIKQRARVNQAINQMSSTNNRGKPREDLQMIGQVEKKQSISEIFGLSQYVNQGLYSVK